jgi:hypothetical protein
MASPQELTQASLNEWFDYDGKTLSWKDKTRETKICFNETEYPVIRFAKNARLVHRLVYLMWHGNLPKEIDHINNDKKDYSITNLRPATSSQNKVNRGAEKQNRSGYKGVCWDIRYKRWQARAAFNKKKYNVVGFKSAEDAHDFVCLLRDMLHGEFANHKGVTKCPQ